MTRFLRPFHGLVLLASLCVALVGCGTAPVRTPAALPVPGSVPAIDPLPLIRNAADQEALYTLAGGLKPMSSGFWQASFEIEHPDFVELEQVRHALGVLRNDTWYADVQVFAKAYDGERSAQAFVVHQNALRRMIERHADFWGPWGITPSTHPAVIVAIVDRMPKAERWRGYGHLFGYPDAAVDFFVEAGHAGADGGEMGPGKDRQFVQIPTHAFETGRFTYAVPLGHTESEADTLLAARAATILSAYRDRRSDLVDTAHMIEALDGLDQRFEAEMQTRGDDDAVLDAR